MNSPVEGTKDLLAKLLLKHQQEESQRELAEMMELVKGSQQVEGLKEIRIDVDTNKTLAHTMSEQESKFKYLMEDQQVEAEKREESYRKELAERDVKLAELIDKVKEVEH
ncbi:hypothetical protein C8Q75DRAFT_811717 [Abortiporus biennis]|nr:hypothetical protein C8Q75DRAFT_811717 [Abortiporus biennis]